MTGTCRFNTSTGTLVPVFAVGQNRYTFLDGGNYLATTSYGVAFPLNSLGYPTPTVSIMSAAPRSYVAALLVSFSCYVAYGDVPPIAISYASGDYYQSAPNSRYLYQTSGYASLPTGTGNIPLLQFDPAMDGGFDPGWNYNVTGIVLQYQIYLWPTT